MQQSSLRVLVAMSGGVDSSVAAWLLRSAGYDCVGAMMRLYSSGGSEVGLKSCCSDADVEAAAAVALQLDMHFRLADFVDDFHRCVIKKFVEVYEAGGTPNPCIDCNRHMKFGKLYDLAHQYGCTHIASGHYARVERDEQSGRFLLKKAADSSKDQSYMLYMLTQNKLAHTIFPLGELKKTEVREIARQQGFANARKRDSQDICFVPDGDYLGFLERYNGAPYPPGDFVGTDGRVLGQHRGAVGYTVGKRRGLGISADQRLYVLSKDMAANTVTVGHESELYSRGMIADELNWIAIDTPTQPVRASVKYRYRQAEQPATLYPEPDGRVRVEFDQPQRAIAAGQAAVFYDGDTVVGGGTITEVIK